MSNLGLVEIDSLEALVIVDNELDPMSSPAPDTVQVSGLMPSLATHTVDRGGAQRELKMDHICCSAHGLSILVTATKDNVKHSILFDAGPEEDIWERNARRLHPGLSSVELIQLSHWHRDHSGGLLRAIRLINEAKAKAAKTTNTNTNLTVDLHPDRPEYRGFCIGGKIISLEADPSFEEIERAGAVVDRHADAHTVLDDMFLISGMIPRVTPYETGLKGAVRYDSSTNDWLSDELIRDERLLMCNLKGKGIIIFTGCSHAGVVNACKHAVNLLHGSIPLHAVVGGYHLATDDQQHVKRTVEDLKRLDPAVLLPGHCTGWRAKFAIENTMPGTLVPCTVGIKITF